MGKTTSDEGSTAFSGPLQLHIVNNLTEGIIVTDMNGTVLFTNRAACSILRLDAKNVNGRKFAELFFGDPENDAFTQTVLDALYASDKLNSSVVSFHTGKDTKLLRMYVSFFPRTEQLGEGFIIVFTDLTELQELKESAQDMARISKLNRQMTLRNELLQKTFGMYLSDELVRSFLDNPNGPSLGGSKRTLTIMMSDLRGFTSMSEAMEADALIDMLNHYLGIMTDAIQKYNGLIIEFIGDGIMALFGALDELPSHAADAVAAALEMQSAMTRINQWNARKGYPRLEMGIGLNTGEVIVGNVGSRKRMKFGVVGSQVNLCGRIESYTIGGQILISSSTRDAVLSRLQVERELVVSPKGTGSDITLSQITGIGEPYNISIKARNDSPKKLKAPIPVCFFPIHGKHTGQDIHYGGFTALGRGTALLQTEADLSLFDNIRVQAGGRLLCKVIDTVNGEYLLHFTSIPSGYAGWVKSFS